MKAVLLLCVLLAGPARASVPVPPNALAVEYSVDGQEIFSFRRTGFEKSSLRNVQSLSKSILALIFGIALEQGKVTDLEENVAPLLGDKFRPGKLTWKDLLTMRSGFPSTSRDAYGAWVSSPDWVRYFTRFERKNGFSYSTGDSHLLAVALKKKLGGDLPGFAAAQLFRPLGIDRVVWDKDPQGNEFGGNNMRLSFEAVSAIGRMLLADGRYSGRQVVPVSWIREMRKVQTEAVDTFVRFEVKGYGYYWWIVQVNGVEGQCALGYGGQFLCLFPELGSYFLIFSRTPERSRLDAHYQAIQRLLAALVKPKG